MKNVRHIADIVAAVALHVFVYLLEVTQEVACHLSPNKNLNGVSINLSFCFRIQWLHKKPLKRLAFMKIG